MGPDALEHHLASPQGRGRIPSGAAIATAGSAVCGDLVRFGVVLDGSAIEDAGFEAAGCGATLAAASAAVGLVRERSLLDAARVGRDDIVAELGGLSAGKLHAAELASDALHRALGLAAHSCAALTLRRDRVLVAMSAGVDSTVAALLEQRAGRDVVAVTLELWADRDNDGERSCCSAQAVRDARSLAHGLGLSHFTLDLRDRFRAGVVDHYIAAHARGETPNPCIRCNGHLRLDEMLALADRIGAARLATGHYARTSRDGDGPLLRGAADASKDQTYMLAALAPQSLARMSFPLGDLTKPQVRALAADAGLAVASRPESQDLCFMAGTRREVFLERHGGLAAKPGAVVDRAGRVLGRHRGQQRFTVGQRRGLGVGGGTPLYVLEKDATSNLVVVGRRDELRRRDVELRGATLHRPGAAVDRVKLRYRARPLAARLAGSPPPGRHNRLAVELIEPADAVAPGQAAALMAGELIVGWGTIAA